MDWGSAIGAVTGNVFDPISAATDYTFGRWATADQNWENAKAAEKQNKWMEDMSNTAHQREIQDMIKAGLNPILSSGGKGASTPSSASPGPMLGKPALHFPAFQLTPALLQAVLEQQKIDIDRARVSAGIEKVKAEIPAIDAKKRLNNTQAALTKVNTAQKDYEPPGLIRTGVEWLKKASEMGPPWQRSQQFNKTRETIIKPQQP